MADLTVSSNVDSFMQAADYAEMMALLGSPDQLNLIQNGNLEIWQLGTSFAAVAHQSTTVDRFLWGQVSGTSVFTILRSTDTPHSRVNYSVEIDCTTTDATLGAGEESHLRYGMEGSDFRPLVGQTCTLKFWVKSNKTGVYCIAFTNSGRDRTWLAEYSISAADTWEEKTIPVTFNASGGTWDYTTGLGLGIRWALRAGTTYQGTVNTWNSANVVGTASQVDFADNTANYLRLADIRFGVGDAATVVNPPIATLLNQCRRYTHAIGVTTGGVNMVTVFSSTTSNLNIDLLISPEMRIAPTAYFIGTEGTDYNITTLLASDITGVSFTNLSRSPAYIKLLCEKISAFTINTPYLLRFKTTTARLVANAEIL